MLCRFAFFSVLILLLCSLTVNADTLSIDNLLDTSHFFSPRFSRMMELDSNDTEQLYLRLSSPFPFHKESTSITTIPKSRTGWSYDLNPTFLNGTLFTYPKDIKVGGDFAYVSFLAALGVFDVSDPSDPQMVSLYYPDDPISGLCLWDTLLFMATIGVGGGHAMYLLSVSDPYHPQLLCKYGYNYNAWNVYFDESWFAFLCAADHGLEILDMIYPGAPLKVGGYHLNDSYDFKRRYPRGYAVDNFTKSLTILNLSSISIPTRLGSIATPHWPTSVELYGNYAYVADFNRSIEKGDLMVVDISDPYNPTCVNYFTGFTGLQGPYDLEIVDTIMCMSTYRGHTAVLSLGDPANPELLGYITSPGIGRTAGLDVQWPLCFTADWQRGFLVGDITAPANPQLLGRFNFLGNNSSDLLEAPLTMEIDGENAYIMCIDPGLISLDVSNPSNPMILDYDEIDQECWAFEIQEGIAYKAIQNFRLQFTNVSDPGNLQPLPDYYMPGRAHDIAVRDSLAYVADDTAGLRILNISDIYAISEVGFYNEIYYGGQEATSVAISDTLAYVGGLNGMKIVNIADPANPVGLGFYEASGYIWCVRVRDTVAYLAVGNTGVAAVDISDPNQPVELGFYSGSCNRPWKIRLYDKYALIGNYTCNGSELVILDVSDPSNMTVACEINTPGNVGMDAAILKNKYLYLLDQRGLFIYNLPLYNCVDVNGSGGLNILDVTYLIGYLYKGEPGPLPPSTGDVDGNGIDNILDITYLIAFLYKSGPAPVCL